MTDWNPNDPDATRVYYDLSAWSIDHQTELAAAMAEAGIPHAWEGTELMVPEDAEQAADELIEDLEQRLGIEDAAAPADAAPELADDTPVTEIDLTEWPDDERAKVSRALDQAGLAHRWEGPLLLVATDDEMAVDAALDLIENGEWVDTEEPATTATGNVSIEILTTLFLAAERLRRDPLDPDGLDQLLTATDVVELDDPPFGVQPRVWQQTCTLADRLVAALVDDDEPDAVTAMDTAAELHDLLRQHV